MRGSNLRIRRGSKGLRSTAGWALAASAVVVLAGCTPGEMGSGAARTDAALAPTTVGGPATMHRITQDQYRNIIADVFGPAINLGGRLEPDVRLDGLIAVGSSLARVTESGLGQYDKMGRTIGAQVVDEQHRSQMIPCMPAAADAPDEACARIFLSRVGELLFRRPLTDAELKPYLDGASAAALKTRSFYKGLSLSLSGLLTAPQFLYRLETAEADPAAPGVQRLDAYSKASRLSFFLWNAAPDPELLTAAKTGELHTQKGLTKQVERMLASPRLESGVRAFFADMLEFDSFEILAKDATVFPNYTFAVAEQAKEQTLRTIVDHLLTQGGDYRELFTTRKTFLTPLLGSLYRVPVLSPDGLPDAWVAHEFNETSGHAGILTHASFVALHSHPGRTSPTLRGKALREILLCTQVPDPPGAVNFNIVQDITNPTYKTVRQRLTAHATEAMCTGCHKITDPMGLALENFDSVGGFRTAENGAPIDTTGELDGVKFANAAGLGKTVHDNPKAASCVVKKVFNYAVGRPATKSEDEWRTSVLEKNFAADGYRLPVLLRRLALSDTFYRVITPPETTKTAAVVSK